MRLLRLNEINVDIDAKTAIGITFQAYDFKEPGKRKISLSNSFTIPLTSHNQKLIGFANNVQFVGNSVYDSFICDYWIDNEHLIKSAKVKITEITDRIKLYIYEKDNFWDEIKKYKYTDFVKDYLEWLRVEKSIPATTDWGSDFFTGTYSDFISEYLGDNDYLKIPYYFGNLYNYEPGGEGTGFVEDESNIYLSYNDVRGGHICSYVKLIFEFLEDKYNIDFLTSSVDPNIIWQDEFASKIYVPIRDYFVLSTIGPKWTFMYSSNLNFLPYKDATERVDKTMYDFIRSFLQQFNIILDEKIIDEKHTIKMQRFDDIKNNAEVVDFSDNLDISNTKFKPYISGYEQLNMIKYSRVYPGANKYTGAKEIICNNVNLKPIIDLFEIDAYYSDVVENTNGEFVTNISTKESLETFVFLISGDKTIDDINVKLGSNSYAAKLEIAAIFNINNEYLFIDEILAYPKYYEIQKWLTITNIINWEFFKQYYIKQLNGSFFVNKIKGFNSEKSNKPTTIELIRISDKTPVPEYAIDYYVDGFDDPFVDGVGDYFI